MKSYILIAVLAITPAMVGASDSWPGKRFKSTRTQFNYKKFYKQNAKRRCTNHVCQ